MITGVRGLCNGLGPALYGLIFYLFHVDLNDKGDKLSHPGVHTNETTHIDVDVSVIRVKFLSSPFFTLKDVVKACLCLSVLNRLFRVLPSFLGRS